MCPAVRPSDQDGCTAELSLTQDSMGNSHKNHLVWNQQLNQNQTLMEQSLDGPLPKLCQAVTLSHQDGHHSAVALLLKAALIQVSDYRLLGASGSQMSTIRSCQSNYSKSNSRCRRKRYRPLDSDLLLEDNKLVFKHVLNFI